MGQSKIRLKYIAICGHVDMTFYQSKVFTCLSTKEEIIPNLDIDNLVPGASRLTQMIQFFSAS